MTRQRVFLKVGQRFGRGVVIDPEIRLPLREGRKRGGAKVGPRGALMQCDCGTEYRAIIGNLMSGNSRSCGCLSRERRAEAGRKNVKHGLSKHPHFPRWSAMMARCTNPSNPSYERYGGRGITVAAPWHDPAVFIAYLESELGPRPEGHSLDRIDNDGNYEPGNVRWADPFTQRSNQRHPTPRKNPRTHCDEGHEYTPENTIRSRKGRRCRTCRNANTRVANRTARLRARRTQMIPSALLRELSSIAERAMANGDSQAREVLEELDLLRLYDMPMNVTDLSEVAS